MGKIGAASYDLAMAPMEAAGLRRTRRRLLAGLSGRVLDLGVGTGLTLPHYRPGVEVVAVDPDGFKLRRAGRRANGGSVQLVAAEGEQLPFEDASFDAVVLALVLCTVRDPAATVSEVFRVLKPGGVLRALEHVLVPTRPLAAVQRWLTPAWSHVAGGCHLDRESLETLQEGGFTIDRVRGHVGSLFLEIYAHRAR